MSNDQTDPHEKPRDKNEHKSASKRKPIHIDDIKAQARKKTKAAAEAEDMSIEKYEQVEKAIEEGRDGDYTDEERKSVEKIQESFTSEALAQFQRAFQKPWLQPFVANDMFKNMFEPQTSSILQNLQKILDSQNLRNTIQSPLASNFPQNLTAGVILPAETLRAIRNFAAPNQELLNSMPSLMDTFKRMRESLQGDARAAQIAGFATNTQEFLTTDAALRYRWNRPVWHYTNGHALLSIIRNGKLWASSPENLNDSSEMKHGFDIITEAFNNQMEEAKEEVHDPDDWKTVLSKVLDKGYFDSIINDVYYISASAEQDSLTLWRNYADGDGFAIGIDTTVELSAEGNAVDEANDGEHIRAGVPLISGWYRVSYNNRKKQKLAQEFIQNAIEDIGKTAVRDRPDLAQELRKQAIILASVMKHEAFQDEREVRWITTNFTTFDPVHYEHGRRSIVPVLHVMTSSAEDDQPLPLKGLRCSPIPNDSIVRTMQGMLEQGGYAQASSNVEKSQQPFKG